MSTSSEKNGTSSGDNNLMSLGEWNARNSQVQYPQECPQFCRMKDGVIRRLDNDDALEEETLGSGLAAMVNLGEAFLSIAAETFKRIETEIRTRIKNCLK
jgi:hypothetical protein